MLVRVRGGYTISYRNTNYPSGATIDMDEQTFRGIGHLVDVIKPAAAPVEVRKEPEVTVEAMDTQVHRAIVKPVRTRSKK